jgi:glycosyltransferase involved in cell wall biosynthesis
MQTLDRARLVAIDRLRFSKAVRLFSSIAIEERERLRPLRSPDDVARSVGNLCRAARARYGLAGTSRISERMNELMRQWSPDGFHWDKFFPANGSKSVSRALILKRPRAGGEKGVLFLAFEFLWMRLFRYANLGALSRDYDLVLSPTWSPPHDLAFFIANRLWPGELFTILSNFDDAGAFESVYRNVHPIPLLASSWVDPRAIGADGEAEKQYDFVMLANFAEYKRHFALFRALARMQRSTKVLLLGVPWAGRSRETLERDAELLGVREQVVIKEGLYGDAMFRELRLAKVSVVLSLLEGSCVAVTESLFAGLPVGVLKNARIGSKAFINSSTGRLLNEGSLASELADFAAHYRNYEPRKWALEAGIGCQESSKVLNEHLKKAADPRGLPWTADIVSMHWRPDPRYVCPDDEEAMREEYATFGSKYGVTIEPGP